MKIFTKKGIVHKIIIALVIVILLFQFCMPPMVQASVFPFSWSNIKEDIYNSVIGALKFIGESMLIGSARVVAVIGDLLMSALNNWMLRNGWLWKCHDFTRGIW